jgi:hypothetical protein
MASLRSYSTFKEALTTISQNFLYRMEEEGRILHPFYEAINHVMPKSGEDCTKRKITNQIH